MAVAPCNSLSLPTAGGPQLAAAAHGRRRAAVDHLGRVSHSPSHLQAGDDDDVAVLFTMPDGSKAFVIGNIEEVTVASGTVDARRALSGTGAEYLRLLEKSYRNPQTAAPTNLHLIMGWRAVCVDK